MCVPPAHIPFVRTRCLVGIFLVPLQWTKNTPCGDILSGHLKSANRLLVPLFPLTIFFSSLTSRGRSKKSATALLEDSTGAEVN